MAKNKFQPKTTTIASQPSQQVPLADIVSQGGSALASIIAAAKTGVSQDTSKLTTGIKTDLSKSGTTFNPAVQSAPTPPPGSKENPLQWGQGGIQGTANFGEFVQVMPPGSTTPVTMTVQDAVKFNQAVNQSMPGASIAVPGKQTSQPTGGVTPEGGEEDLGLESTLKYKANVDQARDPAAIKQGAGYGFNLGGNITSGAASKDEYVREMGNFANWLKSTYGSEFGKIKFNPATGKFGGFGTKGGQKGFSERQEKSQRLEELYKEFAGPDAKYEATFRGGTKKGVKGGLFEPAAVAGPPDLPTGVTGGEAQQELEQTGKETDITAGGASEALNKQLEEIYGVGNQIRDFFETGIGNTKKMFDNLMAEIGKLPEFSRDNQAVNDVIEGYKEEAKRNELDKFYDTSRIVNEMYTNLGYAPQTIAGIVSGGAARTLSRNLMDVDSRAEQLRYEALKTSSEMSKNKIASMIGITSSVYPTQFNLENFGTPQWFQSKFAAAGGEQLQYQLGAYQTNVNKFLGMLDLAVKEKAIDKDTASKFAELFSQPLITMPGQFDFGSALGGLGKLAGGIAAFK